VYRDLLDLKAFLPSLKGGKELMAFYDEKAKTKDKTMMTITAVFFRELSKLMPPLAKGLKLVRLETGDIDADLQEARKLVAHTDAEVDEYDDVEDESSVPGEDEQVKQYDPLPEAEVVRKEAAEW
jgi:hypothetical protein